jgi:hypothetical protein
LECTPPEQLNWEDGGTLAILGEYDFPLALPAETNDQEDISFLVDLPPRIPSDPALCKAAALTWQIDLHLMDVRTRGPSAEDLFVAPEAILDDANQAQVNEVPISRP